MVEAEASGNGHRTLAQGDTKDKGNSGWSLPKMTKSCDKTVGAKVTEPYSPRNRRTLLGGDEIEVLEEKKKQNYFFFKLQSLCPSLRRV